MHNRRSFLKQLGALVAIVPLGGTMLSCTTQKKLFFEISLAEWSLHRAIRSKEMTNLDFPIKTRTTFDIGAVEYVSTLFEKQDSTYLNELLKRAKDYNVKNLLIMVDAEGHLANLDSEQRKIAVENHYKWVDAAKFLGCHSIRVNAAGKGTPEEVSKAAIQGLGALTEYASKEKINVIVENHGGYSSNGAWLANVIKKVDNPYCGTLPDFGNFRISEGNMYDRYLGVEELMPFAKGVSAKSHGFDKEGNEIHTDYYKMLKIVKKAGYTGHIGIEYEGQELSEVEGIKATKRLLEKVGASLT